MNTDTYQRIYDRLGIKAVLDLCEVQTAAMCTKVKMRNMCTTDPNYENFHDRVAKKHNLPRRLFDLMLVLSEEETSESLQGLGGCRVPDWDSALNELELYYKGE